MPFTFLAHQAPLLPLVRRFPGRMDGVALLIGTMAPDFAYVLTGTPLQIWAHAFPGLLTFCVPVTLVVAWLGVRVLAPVLPAHLPELGDFHLRDYRALAAHRFAPVRAAGSALVGALSHVGLDHLGHGWGWFALHWPAYQSVVLPGTFLGRPWSVFRLVQYAGHLVLTPLCAWLLWRYGRSRWLAADAARVPEFRATRASHLVLWGATVLALTLAVPTVELDSPTILRLAAGAFVGLLLGTCLARAVARRPG